MTRRPPGSTRTAPLFPHTPLFRSDLAKDYRAGTADEGWIPLQGPEFYAEHDIDLRLGCEDTAIDAAARQVHLGTGERLDYGALLLATGAEPRRLPLPGFDRPNVFALRSLADARALIAACATARSETGRASCRDRVCKYVLHSVVAVY